VSSINSKSLLNTSNNRLVVPVEFVPVLKVYTTKVITLVKTQYDGNKTEQAI